MHKCWNGYIQDWALVLTTTYITYWQTSFYHSKRLKFWISKMLIMLKKFLKPNSLRCMSKIRGRICNSYKSAAWNIDIHLLILKYLISEMLILVKIYLKTNSLRCMSKIRWHICNTYKSAVWNVYIQLLILKYQQYISTITFQINNPVNHTTQTNKKL